MTATSGSAELNALIADALVRANSMSGEGDQAALFAAIARPFEDADEMRPADAGLDRSPMT
jgi:hypothetical protein